MMLICKDFFSKFIVSPLQFYERLALFAHDSIRKQAELTERIKQEVINDYRIMIMTMIFRCTKHVRHNLQLCID